MACFGPLFSGAFFSVSFASYSKHFVYFLSSFCFRHLPRARVVVVEALRCRRRCSFWSSSGRMRRRYPPFSPCQHIQFYHVSWLLPLGPVPQFLRTNARIAKQLRCFGARLRVFISTPFPEFKSSNSLLRHIFNLSFASDALECVQPDLVAFFCPFSARLGSLVYLLPHCSHGKLFAIRYLKS